MVRKVLWAVLVANWVVAALKLAFGLHGGSAALTADGLHSFFDGGSNVVALIALAIAVRPPDIEHPYGHGKFEAIATLGIGVMVGATAVGVLRMALGALLHGNHPTVSDEMIGVTIATLIVNIFVSRIEASFGKKLRSPLLLADAQHTMSDVLVSTSVLVSLVLVRLGFPWADGAFALVVMGFIGVVAWRIVRGAIGQLVDTAQLSIDEVGQIARAIPGVHGVRAVRSRGLESAIMVDLTVLVPGAHTVEAAHRVADQVEEALRTRFPHVVDVVVHVEPAKP
jgi:cation diffusion facilitator family transporter